MNKETMGIVLEISESTARVRVNRHGECSNCGACPGDSAMVMDVKNKICAKPGQRVLIEVPELNVIKAAFIVYILPIISAILGYSAGFYISFETGLYKSALEISFSILFFLISMIFIKKFDSSLKHGVSTQPEIVKII